MAQRDFLGLRNSSPRNIVDRTLAMTRRFLAPLAKKNGIEGLTFQCLRRTFATQFQKHGTVKDAQTQLRHSDAGTTMNIYTQEIPSSVKAAVEALDQKLCGVLNTIEHGLKM